MICHWIIGDFGTFGTLKTKENFITMANCWIVFLSLFQHNSEKNGIFFDWFFKTSPHSVILSAFNSNNTFFCFVCLFVYKITTSVQWTFPRKYSNFYVFDGFLGSFYDNWICMFLFLLLNWCLHSLKVYLEMKKHVPERRIH